MDQADHTALRFVNSIEDDGKSRTENAFEDVPGFLALVDDPTLHRLAPMPLDPLLAFREDLFSVLSAAAASTMPDGNAADQVQAAIQQAFARVTVAVTRDGVALLPGPQTTQRDHLAIAAYDLMLSDDFSRLTECRRCTRLFIDHGRGKGRRWCDMSRCGNRAKAESYRARKRAAEQAAPIVR